MYICENDYKVGDKVLIEVAPFQYIDDEITRKIVALKITDSTTNNGNNKGIDRKGHVWHFNSYLNSPVKRVIRK